MTESYDPERKRQSKLIRKIVLLPILSEALLEKSRFSCLISRHTKQRRRKNCTVGEPTIINKFSICTIKNYDVVGGDAVNSAQCFYEQSFIATRVK